MRSNLLANTVELHRRLLTLTAEFLDLRTAAVSTPTVTLEANSEDLHIFKFNQNTIIIHWEGQAEGDLSTGILKPQTLTGL